MNSKFKEKIKNAHKELNLKTLADVEECVKAMTAGIIQNMLKEELSEHLGYEKHDYTSKNTDNSRNGYSKKTVKSKFGDMELDIPRDRDGRFEPIAVKKNQTDISGLEQKIINMYARGSSTRDISNTVNDIYGVEVSDSMVSKITDKITPQIIEWQNRSLQSVYAVIYLDAIHFNVRNEGRVEKKAVYVIVGIDLDGKKDILGLWIGKNESAKYWLNVVNEIKNRGVEDILIACMDNLSGFSEAILAIYPEVEIQKCVIHQIRNSTKYIPHKDKKEFSKDLKPIYKAINEEEALFALELLEEKWGTRYPLAVKSWKTNWDELSTFFKYSQEIRKIIYTTNCIENCNRQYRKVTKTKGAFPSDEALLKILYLTTIGIVDKWTCRQKDWGLILNQLIIYFGNRVKIKI